VRRYFRIGQGRLPTRPGRSILYIPRHLKSISLNRLSLAAIFERLSERVPAPLHLPPHAAAVVTVGAILRSARGLCEGPEGLRRLDPEPDYYFTASLFTGATGLGRTTEAFSMGLQDGAPLRGGLYGANATRSVPAGRDLEAFLKGRQPPARRYDPRRRGPVRVVEVGAGTGTYANDTSIRVRAGGLRAA
jgi:hypothetical protein